MGVRSQFEKKACLLSSKEMLMGREQSHTEIRKLANKKPSDREESSTVSLPLGLEKLCFKVKMSSHGKWNSNDCGNCQIAGAVLQGKS